MRINSRFALVARLINFRELRFAISYCPVCDARRPFIKLKNNEIAVRCAICRASAVSLSIVSVLRRIAPNINLMDVYELSARGPLFGYLKTHAKSLVVSEYFSDTVPGDYKDGIQCQDVQELTYRDNVFDICTSTEVFEHVPDDIKAFSEVFRVLRPNGMLLFTVPFRDEYLTLERAVLTSAGEIKHLHSPEYHGDPLNESGRILAFRTYGRDIVQRLIGVGFCDVEILFPVDKIPWGYARPVVVASKGVSRD